MAATRESWRAKTPETQEELEAQNALLRREIAKARADFQRLAVREEKSVEKRHKLRLLPEVVHMVEQVWAAWALVS